MKSNELTVNELEIVAGGTMEENQALAKFIREIDPGYKIVRDADVIKWLKEKSGLNFKTLKLSFSTKNTYFLEEGFGVNNKDLIELVKWTRHLVHD